MSEIFAHHAHVFPEDVWAEGSPDALLKTLDACGIDRAVAFAPFSRYVGDLNANRWLAGQIARRDRLVGFGVIRFGQDDIEAQVREIRDLGLLGIKLHPAFQQFPLLGEKAHRVYAMAEQLGLFLTFHTGVHWHRIRDYAVVDHDEIAYRYPALRFSMEHMGGYCFFKEALAVLINNAPPDRPTERRLYAGLTSVSDRGTNRFWYLSDAQIHDLIWQVGEGALLFGLDFPYNSAEKIQESITRFKSMNLSPQTQAALFGENLKAALRI